MSEIKTLHVAERPREKLHTVGARALPDKELLAVLLGSGMRGKGVYTLAEHVLAVLDECNGQLSTKDLLCIPGIGLAKATMIVAALEFARRRIRPRGLKVKEAQDVLPLLTHWAGKTKEHFISITLDGAHEVIETRVVTIGLINSSQVHPREVFADAIADRACALIVAHNHPSGSVLPSAADRKVTQCLREAGQLLGIPLLDHIIFTQGGYYSFQENGISCESLS